LVEDVLGDERHGVAAEEDEAPREEHPYVLGEVERFRDVGEVVQPYPDRLGLEVC
jgi:hypothetical protein